MEKTFKIISMMTILAVLACVVAVCFTGCDTKGLTKTSSEQKSALTVSSVTMTMESVLHLSSSTSPVITDGITLTATLTPDYVVNKAVDWSIGWLNPNHGWIKNGTRVTDPSPYLQVTPASDGALTATVKAKAPFAASIVVICTSRANPEAQATCVFDYGQRLADVGTMTDLGKSISSNGVNTVSPLPPIQPNGYIGIMSSEIAIDYAYKADYSKPINNKSVKFYVKASDGFYSALRAKNGAKSSNNWVQLSEATRGEMLTNLTTLHIAPSQSMSDYITDLTTFNAAVLANTTAYDYEVKAVITTDYEVMTYTFQCKFDRSSSVFSVSSVKLSGSSYVL